MSETRVYTSVHDAFAHLYPTLDPQIAERAFANLCLDEVEARDLEYRQAWRTASAAYYKSLADKEGLKDHRDVLDRWDAAVYSEYTKEDTVDHIMRLLHTDFGETCVKLAHERCIPDYYLNRMCKTIGEMAPPAGDPHVVIKLREIADYVKAEYRAWRATIPPSERVSAETAKTATMFNLMVDRFEFHAVNARNVVHEEL